MEYLKIPFRLIWRSWFYILVLATTVILSPIFLILSYKEKHYPILWKALRFWSFIIVYGMGFRLKIKREQKLLPNKSYMFCANHSSLLDGWILVTLSKNPIVFVGKKELTKIPVFGFFVKRIVITVDRSCNESRKNVYIKAKKRLKNGVSVAIFPEGLVPEENVILAPFKNGAFSLAIEHQIPIVPQIYYDCKRLFSWDMLKGHPGTFRVKQLEFIETKGLKMSDVKDLKEKTYNIMYNELLSDETYMKDTNKPNDGRKFKSPI
ncbi:MAG: 1-acyl-sn-glycerol-3-phosphate acyltransferase [Tenacibaculum sp.]|nr:1-acyl-sn-glycerol-3-phosphate acyltransferase [Tenacibaculum sp.]